ncbi:MAG TPA: transglutaminase domain-containing protein, partial [Anaerolineales bacterium]|nr:transglutaminase domain-containing protein [Anaerolineales bacterium]
MTARAAASHQVTESKPSARLDRVALFLWVGALYLSAVSFPAADWADHLALVPTAALLSAALGLLLAQSQFRGRTAFLMATAYGLFFVGWSLARTLEASLSWAERLADLLGRTGVFLLTVARGEPSHDPLMFVLWMTALFWILGCYGSWVIFRRKGFWGAMLIPGLALAMNMHFYRGLLNLSHLVPIYLLLSLALAMRTEMGQRRGIWSEWRALVPSDASYQIARAGLIAGALLVSVAWLLPGFTAYEKVSAAWNDSRGLLGDVRDLVSDAFGGLRYPVTVVSETFGDNLELGAGRLPSDKPMFVALPEAPLPRDVRVYWRARVLDTYKAGSWETSDVPTQSFNPDAGNLGLPVYGGRMDWQFSITAQVSAMYLLYVPPQPRWINREANLRVLPAGADGVDVQEVTARRFVLEGETYRVLSSLSAPSAGSLRAAGESYPAWVKDRYLQLPEDFPSTVRELAETIAAGAETPYDQAALVTSWLRSNITYKRDSAAPPEGVDPVEWFLTESRIGFCDYYASAEVLMLRALGVPARLAVGFAEGRYDAERNAYYISAVDSHAWPEVFFPSYGWVEFEPTRSQPPLVRLDEGQAESGGGPDAGDQPGDPTAAGGGIPGEDPMFSPSGDVEDVAVAEAQTARRRWEWGLLVMIVGIAAVAFGVIRYRIFRPLEEVGDEGETRTVRGWSWWASTPARRAYYSLVQWS